MIGIVVSRADEASVHVAEHLQELADFERVGPDAYRADGPDGQDDGGFELREFDDLHLHVEDAADAFDDPEFVVFVSRHSGDTGPLLSAHFTGNFGPAEYGGADRSLAPACPNAGREVLAALREHAPEGYDVAMECTHHGPTSVGAPSMFVELGSSEAEWADPGGARAVARAVLDLARVAAHADRTLVAFGGGHYAPRPTRIAAETEWAVGHVAADWGLDELGDPREHGDLVAEMFAASGAECAVVDGDRPAVEAVVSDLGFRVVGETWVRETDGVPLALVDALERDLAGVEDGLRFGNAARDASGDSTGDGAAEDYLLVGLAPDLLDAAHAVDADATVDAALATALAAETAENGNRLAGTAAFPDEAAYRDFLDCVVDVLAGEYDDVTLAEGELSATGTAFDPAAARDLGVPEGPKFGRLANGDAVTVDGETVTPEQVSRKEHITLSVGLSERARERVRHPSDGEGKGN